MRLTILTQYYPPESGAPQRRLSDLAKRLTRRGHRVQVLTALPNYPGDRVFPEYAGKQNSVAEESGIRVARINLYVPPLKKTVVQRLRCYFSFAFNVARSGRKLLEPTDLVLMESPPLTLAPAGVMLARSLEALLVCNISDLWPQTAKEMGMLRPGPMLRSAEWLESWTYSHSDALSGQTEGICAHLRAMQPDKPIHFYPNGVDLEAYAVPVDVDEVRARFGWQPDEFVAGYTGLFGHAQALEQLLDAARRLTAEDRIRIVLFGDGPCRQDLEEKFRADGALPWVSIYGPQPPSSMAAIQAALDLGIVPLARQPVLEGARPSKMLEIMGAGRAVLLCGCGEAARLLNDAPAGPAGIAVTPEDPAALACALKILSKDRARCKAMGDSGRLMVARDFDRQKIAEGLEVFLTGVVAGNARSNV